MENPNITRLLEMLDNPDEYSEQEIRDIINKDEDTREAYRLMVTAKQGYIHRRNEQPVDAEAAWQRLCDSSFFTLHSSLQKIAASFIGVLLISGIAFAAIQWWSLTPNPSPKGEENSYTQIADTATESSSPLPSEGSGEAKPVIFDNTPLEEMLPEIAAHYNVKVIFNNDEVRGLRFRFVWNPQQGIEQVVSDLNQFERLTVTLKDNQLIVE